MISTFKIVLFSSFLYVALSRHMDFRERFLERKRVRALKDERVAVLNKMLPNTVILDEITHYRKTKGRFFKKIKAIEKDFRRLLAMEGMKYNYKRDLFWRTWRSIPPVNGATSEIVSYKCNHLKLTDGTACNSCGTWTIEEKTPPCAFEFFSLMSDEKFCGASITQYKDTTHNCPSVIKFSDLTATCDNPIETQWQFKKMYGITETHEDVICENQDVCDIFTSYEITPEHVVFRIVNATNDIIYSRIMKPKNKNYICVEDCGRFNPGTRKVAKPDGKPLKLDLLRNRKIKRNDHFNETVWKKVLLNEINQNLTKQGEFVKQNPKKREKLLNEMNDIVTKRTVLLNKTTDNVTESNLLYLNSTKQKYLNDMDFMKEIKRQHLHKSNSVKKHGNIKDIIATKRQNNLNKYNSKKKPVNGMNDIIEKRKRPLNKSKKKKKLVRKMNENNKKTNEPKNEMNESDADKKVNVVTNDSTAITEELINDTNESEEKEYVLNEMTDSMRKESEVMNELRPMERDMLDLNLGATAFDLVSIEVNPAHNIKSRGKQSDSALEDKSLNRPESIYSAENQSVKSIFHKPTVTPSFRMKRKEDYAWYEDGNGNEHNFVYS